MTARFFNYRLFLRFALMTLILLVTVQAQSQSQYTDIRFGKIAEVTFPGEPYADSSKLQDQYGLSSEDGNFQARYLKSGMYPFLQDGPEEDLKKSYQEYLIGLADGLNGKVVTAGYFEMDGYLALEAELRYDHPVQGDMTTTTRTVTIGGKIYSASYANSTSDYDFHEQSRDRFLNSFKIGLTKKALKEKPDKNKKPMSVWEMIGRMLLASAVIIGITLGAVYFATRKSKAERAKEKNDL